MPDGMAVDPTVQICGRLLDDHQRQEEARLAGFCCYAGLVASGHGHYTCPWHPTVVEKIAREFHWTYENLAPAHGYATRDESAVPWKDVPENNRALMVAVVAELLGRGIIDVGWILGRQTGAADV